MADKVTGTLETKKFFDDKGWRENNGKTLEASLFGSRENGPLHAESNRIRLQRVADALGKPAKVLEVGCGGKPERFVFENCGHYTGSDFSEPGLVLATRILENAGVEHAVQAADATSLPFADGSFDGLYSAHMLYHIDTERGQAQAIAEMMRVLRPGGTAVISVANPYPILFPVRALRRAVAAVAPIRYLANRLRKKPPVPFLPMGIGWMKRQLRPWGRVELTTGRFISTWFDHHVSEFKPLGRSLWRAIVSLERSWPRLSTRLGCHVTYIIRKKA